MADTFLVSVNLEKLRCHRSVEEQREMSESDVRQWLTRFGFYPRLDGLYLAEEAVLKKLDPSEVLAARPVGTIMH
jgi:hypothetical protein